MCYENYTEYTLAYFMDVYNVKSVYKAIQLLYTNFSRRKK